MTDTYLVLTTPTTTDVFPVRDIDRIYHLGGDLRVATKPVIKDGLGTSMAVAIPTDDPAEALRIATQALTDAIRTGQSVRADVGCIQLAVKSCVNVCGDAPGMDVLDCETRTPAGPGDIYEAIFGINEASPEKTRDAVRRLLDAAHDFAGEVLSGRFAQSRVVKAVAE